MSDSTQTHRLEMGEAGSAILRLTFRESEIVAALDVPAGLKRKGRRMLDRWSRRIFRRLDGDARGMRLVTTSEGRAVSIGAEHQGTVVVFSE